MENVHTGRPTDIESLRRRNAIYTVQQIRVLYNLARIEDRALLLLSLNCGLGAAEIAQLRLGDFIDGHSAKKSLPVECYSGESVVVVRKPLTCSVRTILLWSETANALRKIVRVSDNSGCGHLFCPVLAADGCQAKSCDLVGYIQRRWERLLRKAHADTPDLPPLPFGSLMKTTIMALVENTPAADVQAFLGHHRSRHDVEAFSSPVRLFESIRELRLHFRAVFESENHSH